MSDILLLAEKVLSKISLIKENEENWASYKDIFEARLQAFNLQTEEWLLGAVIGEIGFNTFDHNFSFSSFEKKGLYCDFEYDLNTILMFDFGCGIKKSLSKVKVDLKSNMEALRIAFTQIISGRAPEQRGNGLKFVLNSVVQNQWDMYFQSGDAYCLIDKSGYSFGSASQNYNGCFCILRRK